MEKNKDFDQIMREITGGLSGDPKKDMAYLKEKGEEYKDHELATEILRACGRMMYDLMPDDTKKQMEEALNKDMYGTEAALEEARFNIYKKDYDKALKILEDLVKKLEELDAFKDDQVSEYHVFDELLDEILYTHLYKPEKELRQAQIPYPEIYFLYGNLLVELKRIDEARNALKKGLRWNPVSFQLTAEYIETFKMEGNMEEFFSQTLKAFKIATRGPQVARCLRNLGYYFVEKELYKEALACYMASAPYDSNRTQIQSEMYYIQQMTGGKIKEPTDEEMKAISEKYGFPLGPDKEVIEIIFGLAGHFMREEQAEPARYFLTIGYELTGDEEIKGLLDKLPQPEGDE